MDLDEARTILGGCVRHVIHDRTSGADEVGWDHGEGTEIVALGWFAGGDRSVGFTADGTEFTDDDATTLRYCGSSVQNHPLQVSEAEEERESLARLAAHASPYDPRTGGGLIIV